jgi:glutathione S-transferase
VHTLTPTSPVLFGLERSVYTRIARLALEEKGVPYSLHEVEIFGPGGVPEEHFKRHPFGRIPVLRHGDLSLYETSAITRYVDEAFPGPALQPTNSTQRARMNQAIGLLDAYAYRPMVWGVFVQRVRVPLNGGAPNEAEISNSLQSAATCLVALDTLLGSAPFLAGEYLSLADLHAFPILRYFCLAPEGYASLKPHRGVLRWYEAMLTRSSVSRTTTKYELANP